jgi:hypothetical protein
MQVPIHPCAAHDVKQFHEGRRCPVSALESKIAAHIEHPRSPSSAQPLGVGTFTPLPIFCLVS